MATTKIRFYLDENIHHHVADGLRHRGIEVLTTPETGHRGWTDEEHMAYAVAQGCVIVTQDSDFLRFHQQGVPHTGLAYYEPQTRTVKEIISGLILIHDVLSPQDMVNHIEYL